MKQDSSKKMLFEMMNKVGGMPLNENYDDIQDDILSKLFEVYDAINGTYLYPDDHSIFYYKNDLEDKLKNYSVELTYPDGTLADIYDKPYDAWVAMNNNEGANPKIIK